MTQEKEELNVLIKRDIARFYLTGLSPLKKIREHYNLSPHSISKLVSELVDELNKKTNSLY